ncbi:GNAT family N-acetyltransferase [Nocardia terpenica]|uniref:GNAT family N-acetyltransferase n=1 Tax=Nocardia terpenica TaxID=455432 RepID=UPI002FE10984
MGMIAIRPAGDRDLASVAELRWQWLLENEGTPATTHDEFIQWFASWAQANSSSHRCLVVTDDDTVIGMGWLAITQRVPTPRSLERASGDVQCVYVVPDRRSTGLGGELIDALIDLARELRLERVTVHSSTRAIPAYSRRGFAVSDRLLQTALSN